MLTRDIDTSFSRACERWMSATTRPRRESAIASMRSKASPFELDHPTLHVVTSHGSSVEPAINKLRSLLLLPLISFGPFASAYGVMIVGSDASQSADMNTLAREWMLHAHHSHLLVPSEIGWECKCLLFLYNPVPLLFRKSQVFVHLSFVDIRQSVLD
ncbi:uncharacterized protein J3D65DRAFT_32479 [Phyllosticta citribraziliensis]|uniref:Uncharacterized protein n=1 Tax=Phyllosticta citribraziliensis TaxID=989973 RepID=A0ABR1M9Z2_9PEZI